MPGLSPGHSDQGAVRTVLDWRSRAATPQGALPPITVLLSVRLGFNVSRVESVRQGASAEPAPLQFAAAQQGEGVNISFATELNVGDFILLWRAPKTRRAKTDDTATLWSRSGAPLSFRATPL